MLQQLLNQSKEEEQMVDSQTGDAADFLINGEIELEEIIRVKKGLIYELFKKASANIRYETNSLSGCCNLVHTSKQSCHM